MRKFFNDECGAIVSAEIVIVLTIAVIAMIVGLSEVAVAVNTELNDVSNSIGHINQSFTVAGFQGSDVPAAGGKTKSSVPAHAWTDALDNCDTNDSCTLLIGTITGGPDGQ